MRFPYFFLLVFWTLVSTVTLAQKQVKIKGQGDLGVNHPSLSGVMVLKGNVMFQHEGSVMTCDSAYFSDSKNSFEAFNNVHINIGDTLFITGQHLIYNGDTRIMEMFDKVVMRDPQQELTTNYLNYDRNQNLAFYSNGGKIVDANNTLTSKIGYYYAGIKQFFFKTNVHLVNPKYVMDADTLMLNTVTNVAYFFGKSHIVTNDSTQILCRNGWFDTQKNISQFNRDAVLIKDGRVLTGDSLYYNGGHGIGRALKNVTLTDTAHSVIFKGNYIETRDVERKTFLTDSALAVFYDSNDTLFLHADTLLAFTDSAKNISKIFGYHGVRFFSNEFQGVCDSLAYIAKDSMMTMFYEPVLWNHENQMYSDTIKFDIRHNELKRIFFCNAAFLISESDSGQFDQIKGLNMIAYMDSNRLQKLDVFKNSECLYYVRDDKDKTDIMAVVKSQSIDMAIYMKDNKVDNISCITDVEGNTYPIEKIAKEELILRDFKWLKSLRPIDKNDIFSKRENRAIPISQPLSPQGENGQNRTKLKD